MSDIVLPRGSRAVMNRRLDPLDSLDFFPTPPWATRALFRHVIADAFGGCWDPCAGEGHMAEVLREWFATVHASDVHDYGCGYAVGSFVGEGPDRSRWPALGARAGRPDWIVFNPPFNLGALFVLRALEEAEHGVAALVRTNWLEGGGRYAALFHPVPPTEVAIFVERVAMVKGCWDPDASTMTSYAWCVWRKQPTGGTDLTWIPPGRKERLTRPDDRARFAQWTLEAPATLDQEMATRNLLGDGATRAEIQAALGVGKHQVTRFLRDIAKADAKKRRVA